MADAVIQLPPDSSGKMADHESLTVGANTVYRQRNQVAGASALEIARVINAAPAGTEYGLVTRNIPYGTQVIQGLQSALQSGAIIAATTVVGPFSASGYNLATVGVAGTYAGVTFVFEGSPDGANWFSLQGQRTDTGVAETGGAALTNTVRAWDVFIGGWTSFRVRATAWTSGSASVLVTFQTMPTEPVPTVVQGPAGTAAWLMGGDVANAVADAGSPNKIGGVVRIGVQTAAIAGTAGQRVNASFDGMGTQWVSPPATWTATHAPAAATAVSASKAAAAGAKLVCMGVSFWVSSGATAPTAAVISFLLVDNVTTVMTWNIQVSAATNAMYGPFTIPFLWVVGAAVNTSMTLKTSAAPGANLTAGGNIFGTTTV